MRRKIRKLRDDFSRLQVAIRLCQKCVLHKSNRLRDVGDGPVPADLMLVGEAFGEQEARVGKPFVGPAGQLLRRMLERCGVGDLRIFYTNTVACFPPPMDKQRRSSKPSVESVSLCKDWLRHKVYLVSPKVVVTVGNLATSVVLSRYLDTQQCSMSALCGREFELQVRCAIDESPRTLYVIPCYHTSFLLRNKSLVYRKAAQEALAKAVDLVRRIGSYGDCESWDSHT